MGDVSILLSIRSKKDREGWELLFTLLYVKNVKFMKESPFMAVKRTGVERGRLVVIFHESIKVLNSNRNFFFSGSVKA